MRTEVAMFRNRHWSVSDVNQTEFCCRSTDREVSSSIETAEQNETSVENPSSGTKAAAPENNGTENAEDVDLDESSNSDVTDASEGQSPQSRKNSRALETVDKTGILTFHSTSSGSNVTYEMKLMRSYTNSSGELIEELVDIQSYVQQSSQQYTWTDLPQYIQVGDQQVEYDYYVKFSGLDNAYGSIMSLKRNEY